MPSTEKMMAGKVRDQITHENNRPDSTYCRRISNPPWSGQGTTLLFAESNALPHEYV